MIGISKIKKEIANFIFDLDREKEEYPDSIREDVFNECLSGTGNPDKYGVNPVRALDSATQSELEEFTEGTCHLVSTVIQEALTGYLIVYSLPYTSIMIKHVDKKCETEAVMHLQDQVGNIIIHKVVELNSIVDTEFLSEL